MSSNQDGIAEGHLSECEQENRMLRAEREVWANIAQERNDLRAENERLNEAVLNWQRHLAAKVDEIERLRARCDAAERLIEIVRAREIGTAGGVGAAFEAYDALDRSKCRNIRDARCFYGIHDAFENNLA